MSEARFLIGDTREVVASLPERSVDLVLTSPPFLALRSYLPDDHPAKDREIGQEPTPGEFVDALLDLVVEWRRVLTPHGTIAVELGDTYSGSGGAGGDYADGGLRDGQPAFSGSARRGDRREWPLGKSLALVPELFRVALAYGVNPLTGRRVEPWRVRNVVRWCRPNPPVGSLADKFRPGTSDMVVACTSHDRFFDLDAVRDQSKSPNITPRAGRKEIANPDRGTNSAGTGDNPLGAPPLDWWVVPTEPYAGSHYAAWPRELCLRPILAMSPPYVCRTCGEPRRRIVERDEDAVARNREVREVEPRKGRNESRQDGGAGGFDFVERVTLGWTDCGHDDYRRGVVLDPFAGSGTTLAVATGCGRDAIGVDLDERNADLARERVGMFLDVVDTRRNAA